MSTNPETEFSVLDTDKVIVSFDFRDMKYLSNAIRTQQIVTDPEVITGLKEASIELDFSKLEESDEKGVSKFVNGGRVYFEANVFGYHTYSFTTKGFFDKEGYVEPMLKDSGVRWFLNNWVTFEYISVALAAAGVLALAALWCRRSSSQKLHAE